MVKMGENYNRKFKMRCNVFMIEYKTSYAKIISVTSPVQDEGNGKKFFKKTVESVEMKVFNYFNLMIYSFIYK